jgi:hypothetical protein
VVFLHCCPAAIAPHVEWAIAGVLGRPVRLQWTGQPVAPSHLRAEADWSGPIGTGARIAASLRACGLATRARSADDYAHGLAELLGAAWDAELEPYRQAGEGAPVTLLHQVG